MAWAPAWSTPFPNGCTVDVYLDGKIHSIQFHRGVPDGPLHITGDTKERGTFVRFKADATIFETTEYDYDVLLNRLREQAFLNAGVTITFTDRRDPNAVRETQMCYQGGIREFVQHLNRNKTPLHPEVIYLAAQKDDSVAEVAMQYNDSYNENILSFANDINTTEGGTHETGFKSALTRVINDYAHKYKYLKEDDKNLSGDDTREGLTLCDQRQTDQRPVRRPDQDQAGQQRDPGLGGWCGL